MFFLNLKVRVFAFENARTLCSNTDVEERCSFLFAMFPGFIPAQNTKFIYLLSSILPIYLYLLFANFSVPLGCLRMIFNGFFIYWFGWVRDRWRWSIKQNFHLNTLFRQKCQFPFLHPIVPRKWWGDNRVLPESVNVERRLARVDC